MSKNIVASVRARLYNRSKESSVEFQLLLARYACETHPPCRYIRW